MDHPSAAPAVQCAQCGAELPGSAKFCLECGTPVPDGPPRETRRTVTLVFTDVTGSTELGEQLDPEAYRGVMGRYFAVARAAVERHGGRVEKFVGDAVLAVFGLPEVREDDALRAVRAAWELNEAVDELSSRLVAELGVRLQIRTGVNTGAVVTGSARAGGSFATGDAVNTAARLEQAAGPGEVLIGASTHALVRDAVEIEPVEPVHAKGKAEPVPAYRLLSLLDRDRGRRRHEDAPLVGRERESRALDDALERMLATGRSHLITVIGPAGIGKSRLLAEFLARVGDRAAVASGRCVSYGQGITYWPLVQALRTALSLSGTESDELVTHALEQAMGDAADTDRVIEPLMPLLGRSGAAASSETTFWAVRRLLEELAAARPLVLTIDDLHWAEPTLLELIERLRDDVADLPLLLLCQARPELIEQNPGWGSGALNALTFVLDPLDTEHISTSLPSLLGGDPPATLAQIVADWSGGNPLFVEEIVAHLIESGALTRGDDGWALAGDLDRLSMPPTVSALLSSRLDHLPATERDLLERLSIIGLEFSPSDAALLCDTDDLGSLLSSLARRDLLRRVRTSSGEMWAFKHIMVRDAAYESLAKALRADLHRRYAEGLATDDELGLERESFVAHHLAQAARYRRELGARGDEVEELVEAAASALVSASLSAFDRDEDQAAVHLLDEAAALAPRRRSLRSILARRVILDQAMMSFDAFGRAVDQLEQEQDESSTAAEAAFLSCARVAYRLGISDEIDPDHLVELAQELVRAALVEGQGWMAVAAFRWQTTAFIMRGQWVRAAELAEQEIRFGRPADARFAMLTRGAAAFFGPGPLRPAVEFIRQTGDDVGSSLRQQARMQCNDAILLAATRSPEAPAAVAVARRLIEEMVERTGRGQDVFLIDAYALLRDLDAAIGYAQLANDEFRSTGDLAHASTYILFQTALMLERGDALDDITPLIEEAASYTSPHDALSVCYLAACRAVVAARTGELEQAREQAETAIRVVDSTDQVWQQAELRRLVSEAFHTLGDSPRARTLLEEAGEQYRRKEIFAFDDDLAARLARLDQVG
jgi:class 3 adenylate cyclase